MQDNLKKNGKGDDQRINIHPDHEITYWSNQLGVTKERLMLAISKVGPMVADVKVWLRTNH